MLGKVPEGLPGISIAATTVPSDEIDGDFFDFFQPSNTLIDVVVGDVMGKGIPAALIGTAIKTHLLRFAVPFIYAKTYARHEMWQDDLLSPQEILEHAHQEIGLRLLQLEYFVTLFYGRFDLLKNTLTYVDCGSAKPLHYRAKSHTIEVLKGQDFPIGMVEHSTYNEFKTTWAEGDIFVFYSDGVSESKSPSNEAYGVDRISDIVRTSCMESAQEILDRIRRSILAFAQQDKFIDDATLIKERKFKLDTSTFPRKSRCIKLKIPGRFF